MDTAVNMQVVGAEMNHIEALRVLLEPLLGSVPAITARLEITHADKTTVISVTDDTITVQDGGKLFQGDWQLAEAAIAGFPTGP